MTRDQRPENSISNLNQRLDVDFALQAAGLGVWEVDPSSNQVVWDAQCRQLFGLAKDNLLPYEQAIQYIHPQDVTRVDQAVVWAFNPQSGGVYDQTYRTIGADDDQLRWVRFQGKASFSPTGQVVRFAGVAQEVTQQVEANHRMDTQTRQLAGKVNELEQSEERYRILAASLEEQVEQRTQDFEAVNEELAASNEELLAASEEQDQIRQQLEESEARFRQLAEDLELQVQQRTEELAASNEELAASNEELVSINEDFATANEALELTNANLIRSNQSLEQFAYIASHDLQEPLRKIQQFGDLLKSRYAKIEGEEQTYLERIQTAASRMSLLIKDLLAFSRIANSQVIDQSVPLSEVVNQALENLSIVVEESGAKIQLTELPTVQGDRSQLNQLFQNLLSNALKFQRHSPTEELVTPQITVRASLISNRELPVSLEPTKYAENYHLIEVVDNGIGFEEKYLDRIFQVFQRLHGNNEFAGTGIGLAVAQKVVTNHGGVLTASSKSNQGATFCVYLPV